ncbi:DUF3025 domain-containing protein [soil metagenome]
MDRRTGELNLAEVDWTRPWLAHIGHIGQAVAMSAQSMSIAEALQGASQHPAIPAFVLQDRLPPNMAYETHIFETGTVPTRDNLHDFFNGLTWLAFPQTKQRLNVLQATEIQRAGVGAARGPLRDALTLFDENGAVLDAPPALWDALVARDWQRLFVTQRALWQKARLIVFGHALLDKLCQPRKGMTAHVLLAPPSVGTATAIKSIATDDAAMARALDPAHLATKPFVPLPVLGIPGWCLDNENFSFYDDPDVFRPFRPREEATNKQGRRF